MAMPPKRFSPSRIFCWPMDKSQLDALSTAISEFDFEEALLKLIEVAQIIHGADSKEYLN